MTMSRSAFTLDFLVDDVFFIQYSNAVDTFFLYSSPNALRMSRKSSSTAYRFSSPSIRTMLSPSVC